MIGYLAVSILILIVLYVVLALAFEYRRLAGMRIRRPYRAHRVKGKVSACRR